MPRVKFTFGPLEGSLAKLMDYFCNMTEGFSGLLAVDTPGGVPSRFCNTIDEPHALVRSAEAQNSAGVLIT